MLTLWSDFMRRTAHPLKDARNLKDLLARLGDVPLERIRADPLLGTATKNDLIRILDDENVPCELVDGILVQKPTGFLKGILTARVICHLGNFAESNDRGVVFAWNAPFGMTRYLVRSPDASFVSRDRLPGKLVPSEPISSLIPELTVEVLSPSNTTSEMLRKRQEFFLAGTQLFWIVDPNKCTVQVYTAPEDCTTLTEADTLTGGDVLPGFTLKLADLFARVPKPSAKAPKKQKKP
jgi:Uma2 family endonuclease